MGEVEQTIERLNTVLVEAGFPKVEPGPMYKGDGFWNLGINFPLLFDTEGNYIKPKGGEYPQTKIYQSMRDS